MARYAGVCGVAVATLLLVGCGDAAIPTAEGSSAAIFTSAADDPTSTGQPSADVLMEVSPQVAEAGSLVQLYFPAETTRGIAFYLDERVGDAWQREFTLLAGIGVGGPTWAPLGEEVSVDDVGIGGPGPDEVKLPPDLSPGSYRICTANAVNEFCAPFDVA